MKIFIRKILIFFLIFAQNIDCWYTLAVLTSTHNLCFGAKIRKIGIPLHTPALLYKSGVQGGIHYTDMFSWWIHCTLYIIYLICSNKHTFSNKHIAESFVNNLCIKRILASWHTFTQACHLRIHITQEDNVFWTEDQSFFSCCPQRHLGWLICWLSDSSQTK